MGLDAVVPCRCWQDGIATDPPVPRELIVPDGEFGLDLSIPYEGNEDLSIAFEGWKHAGACAHEGMALVREHVADWSGYRLFQSALATAGLEQFPSLRRHLPETNGGSMPAAAAEKALVELRQFADHAELGTETNLVDAETGAVLGTHVPAYKGIFVLADPWQIGVDSDGLFIQHVGVDPPREEFRAMRCTQQVLGRAPDGRPRLVRFADSDSAAEVRVDISPLDGWDFDGRYPRSLQVRTRPLHADDFRDIVMPLTTLCEAAIATGNPIYWC